MWISTQDPSAIRKAKVTMTRAGIPGAILLVLLFVIGFPSSLWTPAGTRDFLSGFICAILFTLSGIFLLGASVVMEDSEARNHRGSGPVINPAGPLLPLYSLAGFVATAVFVFRYLFLLTDPFSIQQRAVVNQVSMTANQTSTQTSTVDSLCDYYHKKAESAVAKGSVAERDQLVVAWIKDVKSESDAAKIGGDWVVGCAAEALGILGDKRAVEPLIGVLKSGGILSRGSVATALGKLNDARAIEPLKDALHGGFAQEEIARALLDLESAASDGAKAAARPAMTSTH